MTLPLGLLAAFGAFLGWGFGDFFIQRSSREIGTQSALFALSVFGTIVLTPFVGHDLVRVLNDGASVRLLIGVGLVGLVVANLNFLALHRGKLAVVEPIIGLEVPLTVALGLALRHEHLRTPELMAITVAFFGILLVANKTVPFHGRTIIEKGVLLALLGSAGLALSNFLIGVSSQDISPLLTMWVAYLFIAGGTLILAAFQRRTAALVAPLFSIRRNVIFQNIFDTSAWICYAFATTRLPISIAATIGGSYIALASLLGVSVSREKLRVHQFAGLFFALAGTLALSFLHTA